MNIYTKTGDKGQTSLIGGRVNKDDIRVEAYGTIDELNGFVGQAIYQLDEATLKDVKEELITIQHELFDCGSDLAFAKDDHPYKVTNDMIAVLEKRIDVYMSEAPAIERFILPEAHLQRQRFIFVGRLHAAQNGLLLACSVSIKLMWRCFSI